VLLNLVGNAIKFTDAGGVFVQVDRLDDAGDSLTLQFRVVDTGIGMTETLRRTLFQPFVQGDDSGTRRFGGTGLGLAISKELVQMMGGEISVESEPGCGSTVTFTARFSAAKEQRARAPRAIAPDLNLLVVDDNPLTRHMLALQLASWNIRHDIAQDALGALTMLQERASAAAAYDIVIANAQLTRIDGASLARITRATTVFGDPRFVLLSDPQRDLDLGALAGLNVVACLRRPVKPERLLDAILGDVALETGGVGPVAPSATNAASVAQPEAVAPRVQAPPEARAHVLVVEDHPVNQIVALRQLQKLGYSAEAVGNGREALDALNQRAYDAILMDCQMPEMDGYQATTEIRRRQSGYHTPIIAVTAAASDADESRCRSAGMDDVITKPVRESALAAVLRRWLGPPERKELDNDEERQYA
jgi:CheY-like chemotaxis protein